MNIKWGYVNFGTYKVEEHFLDDSFINHVLFMLLHNLLVCEFVKGVDFFSFGFSDCKISLLLEHWRHENTELEVFAVVLST